MDNSPGAKETNPRLFLIRRVLYLSYKLKYERKANMKEHMKSVKTKRKYFVKIYS